MTFYIKNTVLYCTIRDFVVSEDSSEQDLLFFGAQNGAIHQRNLLTSQNFGIERLEK
jgi:hypothetical protein